MPSLHNWPIIPSAVLASTEPPSLTKIFESTPVTGERISRVTLSVSIPISGSPKVTGSPALLNYRPIDNLGPAFAMVCTRISVNMELIVRG